MPHQDQSPKLGPPVDLGVSAGPRPLERTPMTTSRASFDASTIPVTTPVTPSTLYIEEPSILKEPSILNKEEFSVSNERNLVKPGTPIRPRKPVTTTMSEFDSPADTPDNPEEPVTTPVIASIPESTPIDNPDDNLVIPRHPDPRIKLGYLETCEKSEEIKSPMVYGKIDGRIAQIMLDNDYSTYVLSTEFANIGNIPYFPCKPVPVELALRDASQFTLNTQTKKLPMEVGNITQSRASYILPLPSYDAIFGMPFLNGRKLVINSEKGIVTLDDIELPLIRTTRPPVSR